MHAALLKNGHTAGAESNFRITFAGVPSGYSVKIF